MGSSTTSVAPGRLWIRQSALLIGGGVAVLAALVAAVLALYALEWGSDSRPVTGVFSAVPAALSAGLIRWLTAGRARPHRTAAGLSLSVLGLAVWAVALTGAFDTQSSYSSDTGTGGTAVVWIVCGALGALVALAGSALLPRRARTAGWAVGALVVTLLWAVFAVARFLSTNAVLTS